MSIRLKSALIRAALLLGALGAATPLAAQRQPDQASLLAGAKADREKELEVIEDNLKRGETERKRLTEEIEAMSRDRAAIEEDLIATNARIRASETRIVEARSRFAAAAAEEKALQGSLEARRDLIADVLAALQRIGRHPPPAVIVQPGDILDAVRASIQFGRCCRRCGPRPCSSPPILRH